MISFVEFLLLGECRLPTTSTSGGSTWRSKRSAMPSTGSGDFSSEPPPRVWRRRLQEGCDCSPTGSHTLWRP